MLDIVDEALTRNNVRHVLCRNKLKDFSSGGSIEVFRTSHDINVLLLPLAYGAEGLDLIVASHIFLLEPLLNYQQELQAVNRIYRIGQTRRTMVHKYVVRATVEERIVEFQQQTQSSQVDGDSEIQGFESCGGLSKGLKRDDGSLATEDIMFIMESQ